MNLQAELLGARCSTVNLIDVKKEDKYEEKHDELND